MAIDLNLFYLRAVQAAMVAQGHTGNMNQAEYDVVLAGRRYGIGPYDCAAQIIANRSDATDAFN